MECFSCRRISNDTVNVYNDSSGTAKTVKHHIQEFLGLELASYLNSDQQVCYVCGKMFEEIAKIKYQIIEVILNKNYETQANYGLLWEFLYNGYINQYDDNNFANHSFAALTPASELGGRTLSERSSSRNADVEVARFLTKRRRRGAKSANMLEPKLRTNLRSVLSENDRDRSSVSTSSSRPAKDYTPKLPDLEFDENNQLTMVKTRGISKIVKFYCSQCKIRIPDIIDYTIHMICQHGHSALYPCTDCGADFLTDEHLKLHQKLHDTSIILCRMCGQFQDNLSLYKQHVTKHWMYSVPCSICDFKFLTKREYEKHMLNIHRTRKRKIEYRKIHSVILEQYNYINNNLQQPPEISVKHQDFFSKEYNCSFYELRTNPEPVFDKIGKIRPILPADESEKDNEQEIVDGVEETVDNENELVQQEQEEEEEDGIDEETENSTPDQDIRLSVSSSSSSSSSSPPPTSPSSSEPTSPSSSRDQIDDTTKKQKEENAINQIENIDREYSKLEGNTEQPETESEINVKHQENEPERNFAHAETELEINLKHSENEPETNFVRPEDDSELFLEPPEKRNRIDSPTRIHDSSRFSESTEIASPSKIVELETVSSVTASSSSTTITSSNSGITATTSASSILSELISPLPDNSSDVDGSVTNDCSIDSIHESANTTPTVNIQDEHYIEDLPYVVGEEVVISEDLRHYSESDTESHITLNEIENREQLQSNLNDENSQVLNAFGRLQ